MNNCLENITDHLKPFLLRDIIIRTDKKVLKRGRLKIFQIKQYYINLSLEYKKSIKNYEIPYPFDIHLEKEGTEAVLNYHLSSFVPYSQINKVKCLDTSSKSKIYNNLVYIWPSEEATL
jgi:hypothetical protein|tara:strand:+ start:1210 stop:1566 length:357 start_codon:yes stop_codon:yes gene_type:complete